MYDLINNVLDDVDLIIFHTKNVILVMSLCALLLNPSFLNWICLKKSNTCLLRLDSVS